MPGETDGDAEKNPDHGTHGHGHQAHNAMEDHIPAGHHELMFANMKEGFDGHRTAYMAHINQNQHNRDADAEQRRTFREEAFTLRMKHAENNVETANLAGKATLTMLMKQSGLSLDRIWNPDEVARLTTKGDVAKEAIRAMIVEILAERLDSQEETPPAATA